VSNNKLFVKPNLLRHKSHNTISIPKQFIRNNVQQGGCLTQSLQIWTWPSTQITLFERTRQSVTLWRHRWQEASGCLCTETPLFGGIWVFTGPVQTIRHPILFRFSSLIIFWSAQISFMLHRCPQGIFLWCAHPLYTPPVCTYNVVKRHRIEHILSPRAPMALIVSASCSSQPGLSENVWVHVSISRQNSTGTGGCSKTAIRPSNVTVSSIYSPHGLRWRRSLVHLAACSLGFPIICSFTCQIPAKIPVWLGECRKTANWPSNVTASSIYSPHELRWRWLLVLST